MKPAAALTDDDRKRILAEFFHAPRGRMIDAYPRYAELLQKRDSGGGYTEGDFLDLQVWHKLAWVNPLYLDTDRRVGKLLRKHRGFEEPDKLVLREVELEILRRVIPEYAAAAGRGQVELSASPFYHPILPLLCDTDIYLTTHPYASVPRPPFRRPDDAAEQMDAGEPMPRASVREGAGGTLALGGLGLGRRRRAGRQGRIHVDGHR